MGGFIYHKCVQKFFNRKCQISIPFENFHQSFLFLQWKNLILFQFLNMKNAFWYWIFQKRIEFYVFEDLSLQGRSFGSWIYEFQSPVIFNKISTALFPSWFSPEILMLRKMSHFQWNRKVLSHMCEFVTKVIKFLHNSCNKWNIKKYQRNQLR